MKNAVVLFYSWVRKAPSLWVSLNSRVPTVGFLLIIRYHTQSPSLGISVKSHMEYRCVMGQCFWRTCVQRKSVSADVFGYVRLTYTEYLSSFFSNAALSSVISTL